MVLMVSSEHCDRGIHCGMYLIGKPDVLGTGRFDIVDSFRLPSEQKNHTMSWAKGISAQQDHRAGGK